MDSDAFGSVTDGNEGAVSEKMISAERGWQDVSGHEERRENRGI